MCNKLIVWNLDELIKKLIIYFIFRLSILLCDQLNQFTKEVQQVRNLCALHRCVYRTLTKKKLLLPIEV